jgi:lysophospholipase L1-like esterase
MGRKPAPHLIVALGDSITVGTFSNTTSSPFRTRSQEPLSRALMFSASSEETSTFSAPDEDGWAEAWRRVRSEGLHALLSPLIYNQSTHSWATGRFLDSHEVRIRRAWKSRGQDPSRLKSLNFAVPGVEASGLIEQATRLIAHLAAATLESGGESPQIEYLAMTIGANDICTSAGGSVVPDAVFASNLRQAIRIIATGAQAVGHGPANPVRVLISAIPPIPTAGAPEFQSHEVVAGVTCEKIRRRFFPYCTNLLNWVDEVEFQERMELVNRKNAELESLALESGQTHPELQVVFGASVANARFSPEDLAIDCFHPDLSGQRRLSDGLWRDQPWY